jgi:hypothetical protein
LRVNALHLIVIPYMIIKAHLSNIFNGEFFILCSCVPLHSFLGEADKGQLSPMACSSLTDNSCGAAQGFHWGHWKSAWENSLDRKRLEEGGDLESRSCGVAHAWSTRAHLPGDFPLAWGVVRCCQQRYDSCIVAVCWHVTSALSVTAALFKHMCPLPVTAALSYACALGTRQPNRAAEQATSYFTLEARRPQRAVGRVVALEPSRTRRPGLGPWDTWQHMIPPQ